ncbi:MAG: outer membrane lipoprotein carrier protein LolA [Gemmatimonadota bacterium]|nr:outer membrane lipoprotein carrier protein LolA [Gemmatimonadota bacterium]MDH4347896.1 outer membrane lipoprotein carrier protein LolA [Gemmatimonadota bacterium]MDH5282744.1 outer membrane lipoprotein carrier protein LolA [Gemmatimonadota bacterium]
MARSLRSAPGIRVAAWTALILIATPWSAPTALPALVGAAQDHDPAAIVERAARAYRALSSFHADFKQVIADSMVGTFESRGRLSQAGAGFLVMRFSDPAGDAIVMDGEHIWVYTPSTTPGQVIRLAIPSDPTFGPNVLAWILTNPAERYRSRYLRSDAVAGRTTDVIGLTPVDASLPFTDAVVWLDRHDFLPRKLEIRERGGQRRTLTFLGVEVNRRASSNLFRFEVPQGVRIVDQ